MSKFSKSAIDLMDDIVSAYAERGNGYHLTLDDIPELEKEELAACMLIDDSWFSQEATGADNPAFQKSMLPSLIALLRDSSNPENAIDFVESWKHGVSSYGGRSMQELLDWRLEIANQWEAA